MSRILIVEGNSAEIIERNRKNGVPIAYEKYSNALLLNAPDIHIDVSIPFAPELQNNTLPLDNYDGFALTGSGVIWCAGDQETLPYMDFLDAVLATGKPIIGSCWGMQTVVVAMGGECASNPKGMEVGLATDITLTKAGRMHPFFSEMPDKFDSPCIHRDHVTRLPECFTHLASNPVSEYQAVSCQENGTDYFGFQYHPELDLELLSGAVERLGINVDAPDVIASFPETPSKEVNDEYQKTSVFKHWLDHVQQKKTATKSVAAE